MENTQASPHSRTVGAPGGAFCEHPGFTIQPDGGRTRTCVLRTPRLKHIKPMGAVSPIEVSSKTKEPWVYIFWTKKSRICVSIMHPLRVLG